MQQRVLPGYRAPFFDLLAGSCTKGLSLASGQPLPIEGISTTTELIKANFYPLENLHFSDPSTKVYLCWQRGILNWLADWDPDALIVEANPRYLSNRSAIRWMHSRGRPVLGWGLGAPELSGPLADTRLRQRKKYLHSLDGLIAYSQKGAQEYRRLGISSEKVFVATNAVMARPKHPLPERIDHFGGPPKVLFVGRLQTRKRLDFLMQACAALPMNLQPELIVVGDGTARSEFERMAEDIYPATRFVGAKYGIEIEKYFQQADLFALPGTGGLAVQQAMAYGLPVIVAQGDGTQDDLVRPGNGWQVPPGDQEIFTATLGEALSNIGRLRDMGRESYRIVSEEVNLESMVATFIAALRSNQ